jgi:mRNA interferase MazF
MIKRFLEWIQVKMHIHENKSKSRLVKERDFWWVSLGDNVGSEINGKGILFTRPAIIIKKLTNNFYLIAPTTTKEHVGSWYFKIEFNNKISFVCLHQIRTVDYRRLGEKIGQIGDLEFKQLMLRFKTLYIK